MTIINGAMDQGSTPCTSTPLPISEQKTFMVNLL